MIPLLNQPWPYLATAALAALIGLYAWTQPRRPGSRHVSASAGMWCIWALSAAVYTVVQTGELRFYAHVSQTVCALLEAPLQLMIALEYTGHERWLSRRTLRLLALPAILFALASLTLPHSALFSFENHAGFEVTVSTNLSRVLNFGFIVVVQVVATGVLLDCMQRAPAFRIPLLLIGLGPMITLLAYPSLDPQRLTVPAIQATVLFAVFPLVMYFVALYNFRFLRVIPLARDLVLHRMPYALLVLDAENRVVDLNTLAQALPGLPGKLAFRQAAADALGDWWAKIAPLIGTSPVMQDVVVHIDPDERIFRVASLPLLQASGWRMGQALVLEDVTQARQVQAQKAQAQWAQATLQERELLAQELHDGLAQNLGFLNLQAQAAQVYLQAGQANAALANLDRLARVALQIQDDTRELIGELLTISQPSDGFCATLRQVVAGFEQRTRLPVRLEIEHEDHCDPDVLAPASGVQLLRIVQEALANVRKHAGSPGQVEVRLSAGDGQLQLTVADDGAGFDPAGAGSNGWHFGLAVMRQRAARIGGELAIHSAPGEGTRVEVRVPLPGGESGTVA
jgi:signal transduction histidine kinase